MSTRTMDRAWVTQCALSRICGVCERPLGRPIAFVGTVEEEYVLVLLGLAVVEAGRELLRWTVTRGVHDGLVAGQPPIPDTEHPAGALSYVTDRAPSGATGSHCSFAGSQRSRRASRSQDSGWRGSSTRVTASTRRRVRKVSICR